MLTTKRTYKKKYVIGGAGIFNFIGTFFARMFSSNAVKQLASTALHAGKTAAKYDPISGTNLNNGGDIRISIESQDVFTHPKELLDV